MTDIENKTNGIDYEKKEKTTENYEYCTNPIAALAEVHTYSWLDDYGWI